MGQSFIKAKCLSHTKCDCFELANDNQDSSSTISSPRTIIDSYRTIPPDDFIPINENNHKKTK